MCFNVISSKKSCQFYHFDFSYPCPVDDETYECAHGMPAVVTGCSRIDVQQSEHGVAHDFENVAVPANEESGSFATQGGDGGAVVGTGITADVCDEHVGFFTSETKRLGKSATQIAIVDVSVNGTQGADFCQLPGYLHGTNVACVPDFVAFGKMAGKSRVEASVGVGEQTDSCHDVSLWKVRRASDERGRLAFE